MRLHDTMTREKVELRAPTPGRPITMYVCGPTVYGRAHIGNARPAVVFDTLYRVLRHLHGPEQVRYARNITDIDDKIMDKAVRENRSAQAVAAEYEAYYFADMAALGCLKPDFNPRATEHIEGDSGMIAMIQALVDRGYAYVAEGHVLFEIAKFAGYGALSHRPMDEMIAGARVEVAPYKRGPGDFVLWKPSREDQPGWDSPFGRGRPGWHIECSAMIRAVLETDTIDIHGGGLDLTFPHHENERAQSCCAHEGAELARIWMHNGFLNMGETKMSKSLGNIVTPGELLEAGWQGEVLRLALLSAHYRQPLVWSDALLTQAKTTLDGWYRALQRSPSRFDQIEDRDINHLFFDALADDLNVVEALPQMHAMARVLNEQADRNADESARAFNRAEAIRFGKVLGVLQSDPDEWLTSGVNREALEPRLAAYAEARAAKDWAAADAIRDGLLAEGIKVAVAKDGVVRWEKA